MSVYKLGIAFENVSYLGHLDYSALSSQYGPPVIIQLAGIMAAVRLTPLKR